MAGDLRVVGTGDGQLTGMQVLDGVKLPNEIRLRAVAELLPYSRNSRTHSPAQIEALAANMRRVGFTNPILIADGVILAGHGRLAAAKKLGLSRVPCIDLSHLTEAERRAQVIWDNRSAELGSTWDLEMLKLETDHLRAEGFDLEDMTGFGEEDLAKLFEGLGEEDKGGSGDANALPDPPAVPHSREGDVWLCGPHRVGCGDSCSVEFWERLMPNGEQADLCITDPPYNVDYESDLAGKIKNDSMKDDEFRAFLLAAYRAMFAVMKPGAPIYVAHADTEGLNFRAAFKEAGFKLSGCLIWRKNSLVLGRSDYQWQHEPILYGWKPGAKHRWFGGRKRTTMVELGDGSPFTRLEDGRWAVSTGGHTFILPADAEVEQQVESVLYYDKPTRSELHPTTKPVPLWEKLATPSSRPGDVVIDSFSGSGTTLITAEKMGLKARVCDLDPKFVDVAVRRWEMYTGQKAVHAVTGELFPGEGEVRGDPPPTHDPEPDGGPDLF